MPRVLGLVWLLFVLLFIELFSLRKSRGYFGVWIITPYRKPVLNEHLINAGL